MVRIRAVLADEFTEDSLSEPLPSSTDNACARGSRSRLRKNASTPATPESSMQPVATSHESGRDAGTKSQRANNLAARFAMLIDGLYAACRLDGVRRRVKESQSERPSFSHHTIPARGAATLRARNVARPGTFSVTRSWDNSRRSSLRLTQSYSPGNPEPDETSRNAVVKRRIPV
jgi:hypothetical protein